MVIHLFEERFDGRNLTVGTETQDGAGHAPRDLADFAASAAAIGV